MGSDRARVTYDRKQQYRSVVMQQGRVTLEADWNEAGQITNEEIRREALDFVGPCGTPDDGYLVVPATSVPFDFSIQPGTMYVGGMRAHLLGPVQYSNQPDWRDYDPEDPFWVDLAGFTSSPPISPKDEFVYLYLREQEISAVEDPDLRDVALGGPDTAQRTRLLQRFVRTASSGTDCLSGLASAEAMWKTQGLFFDPDSMRLRSWSTLQVGFSTQTQTPSPCQPQGQGGYLGPDNQLIRVQISGIDQAGNPKFIWGFDDASFFYRVHIDPSNSQSLDFQSIPVDASHQPISGQAVEVLRTAADLPNGGEVAATSGFVFTLQQNYDPDLKSVAIPLGFSLPPDYTNSNQSPPNQLFLRVWEQELGFTPGKPQALISPALGPIGILVTLQTSGNQPFHVGDYWMFAVRSATPQTVYPEHYQNGFQAPDGPRLWACPLGVIAWSEDVGTLVSDCRNQFDNLVDLTKRQQGCCTITVTPQDITGNTTLQTIVKKASKPTMLVKAANPGAPGNNISVEISNLQLNVTPPTFDLTVTQTDIYLGVTVYGNKTGIGTLLGGDGITPPKDGLAHVSNLVSASPPPVPLDNQIVTFTGGQANTKAQAKFMDNTNNNVIFTLEARSTGVDGNITQATISNLNLTASPATFALTVTWRKLLPRLSMATVFSAIQSGMGYEIVATPPTTVAPTFPAEGVTHLSGGAEANSSTETNPTTAQAGIFGTPTKICLRPGSYRLLRPLVFGPEQSNITIEACDTAAISAPSGKEKDFVAGMFHLNGVNNLTLRGLTFAIPRTVLSEFGSSLAGLNAATLIDIGEPALFALESALALAVSGCRGLTVEDCTFMFPAAELDKVLFAAGILAGADCAHIRLEGNLFQGPANIRAQGRQTITNTLSLNLTAGYIQADFLQNLSLGKAIGGVVNGGTLIPSSLDNLVVSNNSFENLLFPVFIATALGVANFEGNVVTSSLSGFTILPLIASVAGAARMSQNDFRAQILANPTAQQFLSIAVAFPRPASFLPLRRIILTSEPAPPAPPTGVTVSQPASGTVLNNVLTMVRRVPPTAEVAAARPAVGVAVTTVIADAAVGPVAPPPAATVVAPIERLPNLSPLALREAQFFKIIAGSDVAFAIIPEFNPPVTTMMITLSNNDMEIDLLIPPVGSLWAVAIADIADLGPGGGIIDLKTGTAIGMLTLTGNKLRNAWPLLSEGDQHFTALAMVSLCTATGNVIHNRGKKGTSLKITVPGKNPTGQPVETAIAAVTGNILVGTPILPPRTTTPPGLPAWTTYNECH
jgi:uncharacterized protein DUF6519